MERERLIQLGKELTTSQLNCDKFLFTRYFQDRSNHKNGCGTVACALGHYVLGSDEWEFEDDKFPKLKDNERDYPRPMVDAGDHFDIPFRIARLMFIPHEENADAPMIHDVCEKYGLHSLPDKPSEKEVGENIIKIANMDEETLAELERDLS